MTAAALTYYNQAKAALALVHRVDEVKTIRDKAVAMQAYAAQAKDTTLITQAIEIRMRAERRAGELLREMAARKERDSGKGNRNPALKSQAATPKLSDLGINKTQSSRWQALAAIDEDSFDAKVAAASKHAYDGIARRFIKEKNTELAKARHNRTIEHGCVVDDLIALTNSGKRFPVILADPAWFWEDWGGPHDRSRGAHQHYSLATLDQIKALPVATLAADDCVLFLWGTWPKLPQALEVISAWGFQYKTDAFVWIKENSSGGLHTGMGNYTRSNSEFCLLATKGSPTRLAKDVHQVVMAPVGKHSAKPEEVRRRIERLFVGPYLELYGRESVSGWTVWGNEIPRSDFRIPKAA